MKTREIPESAVIIFRNREEAGRLLTAQLAELELKKPICVLALPRGGVPVAREVASYFNAPLDLLVVKKIGAPWQPELSMGAVSEDHKPWWNADMLKWCRLTKQELESLARKAVAELDVKVRKWAPFRKKIDLTGRTVVVVDDGLATGATMAAALHLLRRRGPRRIVMAVPVAPASALRELAGLADDTVVLEQPESFRAVGQWYEDFTQVTDDDVTRLLGSH